METVIRIQRERISDLPSIFSKARWTEKVSVPSTLVIVTLAPCNKLLLLMIIDNNVN